MKPTVRVLLLPVLCGACTAEVTRGNPFDPAGSGPLAPGRIGGAVYVLGATSQAGRRVSISDAAGAAVDGGLTTGADGAFTSPLIAPGKYLLEVDTPPSNVPLRLEDVVVHPGATTNVGMLVSAREPQVGRITGHVTLDDPTASPQGVRVVATGLDDASGENVIAYTDIAGNYAFNGLGAGTFEVRADLDGFTPALVTVEIAPAVRSEAVAPEMTLYLASAVARFSAQGAAGAILGAPFTNTRDVNLVLLAFGGVNQMRFSESPTLREDDVEVAWRDYVAETPVTLSAGEGTKRLYVQLRLVDPVRGERLRTSTYIATITYDATPPLLELLDLAPDGVELAGQRYVTNGHVPIELVVYDPYSGLSGVKVAVEISAGLAPYTDVTATGSTVSYFTAVDLPSGDGPKTLTVQLVDAAGNETEPLVRTLVLDTQAPAVAGFYLNSGAPAEPTGSTSISVTYTVTDTGAGAPRVALAEGAFNCATATYTYPPVAGPVSFSISPGDGLRTLHLCARDAIGNTTVAPVAASNTVRLDTLAPAVPNLARTDISDVAVELQWTTPSDTDLGGFILERRLDPPPPSGDERFYTVLATLGPGVNTHVDPIDTRADPHRERCDYPSCTLGRRHLYRIRAFDAPLGNVSAYSTELDAGVPIAPPRATYLRSTYARELRWTYPTGAYLLIGAYSYEDVDTGLTVEQAIAPNTTRLALPAPITDPVRRENERVVLRVANNDGSLAWETDYRFGRQSRVLDGDGNVGYGADIAVDAAGVAHVSYLEDLNQELRYLKLDGSPMVVLSGAAACFGGTDVEVDASGHAHVAAFCANALVLFDVASSSSSTLETFGTQGQDVAMKLDDAGAAHVAYQHPTANSLKYVKFPGGTPQTLDAAGSVGRYPSVALDSAGVVHVAYYDETQADLKYVKVGQAPQFLETSAGMTGQFASLAIDTNDGVHVTFRDNVAGCMKYRKLGAGAATCIDSVAWGHAAMALDRYGTPHLVATDGLVAVRYTRIENPASPQPEEIARASARSIGMSDTAIALDPKGGVHVVYFSEGASENGRLMYVRLDPVLRPRTLDTATTMSPSPSIAVDQRYRAHAAYHDAVNRDLRYVRVGAAPQTLDAVGDVGWMSDIVASATGEVDICYYDATNADLKHVRVGKPPETWVSTDSAGMQCSLAVDRGGGLHVTYQTTGGFDYLEVGKIPVRFATCSNARMALTPEDELRGTCWVESSKLGYFEGAGGAVRVLDTGEVGQRSSLAVDANGVTHIAYADFRNAALKYIATDGRAPITVDRQGEVGFYNAIGLDAAGVAHVVYVDGLYGTLKYARLDGTSVPILLDADLARPVMQERVDLALDPSGVPNVVYAVQDGSTGAGEVRYLRGPFADELVSHCEGATLVPDCTRRLE